MKKLLLLAVFIAATLSSHAQIVINELMQSNIDCIMDDLNEFPDSWVELYNAGDVSVDLKDYKLGIKDDASKAYQLPSYTLAPKAYKIVYCDKYDGNKSWHAPFRLESGKDGTVYLFKGEVIVDQLTGMKKQPAPNVAYGRKKDGDDKWGYQATPTPNAANCGTVYGNKDNIVGDPVFSVPGQVFESSGTFELTLSLPEGSPEGTRIIYTTDGSEPELTGELLGNGHWESKKILAWENPDPAKNGDVSWKSKYRFSNKANYNPQEVIAIIADEAWQCIRENGFTVDILATNPQIRVTNGWWSTRWGEDIFVGNENLVDNGDGTMTLTVNLAGDPILDDLDQKHLLLTGANYTPLRIYATEYVWVEDAQTRVAGGHFASKEFTGEPLKITSSTVVKAKLFCDGYLSPRSVAQSYLFLDRKMTLPVVSITTDDRYLYDQKLGIYVEGTYQSEKKNYSFDWRRPINLELFEEVGAGSVLNQLCETRVQGGASRSNQHLKSLALYANKRFGEKRFKYEFFAEDRPGQTNFKSLLLRNAGNDFDYLYMRDAIIQRVMAKHVDVDWQAWQPAIVFINGKYKGIENFRERSNDDNIFTNYNELEDIEVVENWWDIKTGTGELFSEFKKYYNDHGHTWEDYDKVMDVSEYLDVMIMEIFFNNMDAPGNNFCIWRPTAEGGRWRVILKDVDYTIGLYCDADNLNYNYMYIDWLYNSNYDSNYNWGANSADGTRLFRRLMEDETFKNTFIDRCAVYMGDFMNYNGVWDMWEPMYNMIKEEYPYHRKLVNQWWPNYNDEMNKAKTWLQNRTGFFYQYLADYYKLGAPTQLQINTSLAADVTADMQIEMNGITLSKGMFDGMFFQGREISLKGGNVDAWKIEETDSSNKTSVRTIDQASCTYTIPKCKSIKITAINPAGIERVDAETNAQAVDYFDLRGVRQNQLQRGQNIIRMSDGTVKKVLW